MATDVYVMPLWKFKAGEFDTALTAALGMATTVVTPAGIVDRARHAAGFWRRWQARRQVRAMRRDASRQAGVNIVWSDEGPEAYSNQFRSGDSLRAYLWWRDRRDLVPMFENPERNEAYARRLFTAALDRPSSLPHLSGNNFYNDYFLPTAFPTPVRVDPWDGWRGTEMRTACSTPIAQSELGVILEELKIEPGFSDAEIFDESDPFLGPKLGFDHLHKVLTHSSRSGLPAIFWG